MSQDVGNVDRRHYRRVKAPIYCRPVGLRLFRDARETVDVSLGGVRTYSDEKVKSGARLELELFLPDESSVVCEAEVVWVDELGDGAPARYDVGLKFVSIKPDDVVRLRGVLTTEE